MSKRTTGVWFIDRTSVRRRRILHYWARFFGFMSLFAIWITHVAGWAAETPVEAEDDTAGTASDNPVGREALADAEPG